MKNTQNKKAFSIVMAIWLVLVMSLLVLYIIEYMIPYSKNVKWIENSSNAFYQAENSIEDAMLFFKDRSNITEEENKDFTSNKVDYKYSTTSSWNTIPSAWEWNSEYDKDFNTISQWNPIQLKVWNWINVDWDNSDNKIYFKIPDIWKTETLSWWTLPIINWQLSSDTNNNTLNASWSYITANEIDYDEDDLEIYNRQWINLYWSGWSDFVFNKYYEDNCIDSWSWCTLKMSIINELELTDWTPVPYLEYKFDLVSSKKIPLRYSRIKSSWKSYGFQKELEVKVSQQTTNEAFDFTVFQ